MHIVYSLSKIRNTYAIFVNSKYRYKLGEPFTGDSKRYKLNETMRG